MRTQLAPLLGEAAMVVGTITSKRWSGSQVRICVNNAKVYKWSRFKTTKQMCKHGPVATADHMWIYAETSEDIEDKKDVMYQKSTSLGYISEYQRADGTKDYGLSWIPAPVDAGKIIQYHCFHREYEKVIEKVDQMIELGSYVFIADHRSTAADNWQVLMTHRREAERALLMPAPKPKLRVY